jgi:hypothetical protein
MAQALSDNVEKPAKVAEFRRFSAIVPGGKRNISQTQHRTKSERLVIKLRDALWPYDLLEKNFGAV